MPTYDPDPRLDESSLLEHALGYADKLLRDKNAAMGAVGFLPFGFGLDLTGRVGIVQTTTVGGVEAHQLVELLWDGFREKAAVGELLACAVAYDANVGEGRDRRDAVAVSIEHRDAKPRTLFTPYVKRRLLGLKHDLDGRFWQGAERRAFR